MKNTKQNLISFLEKNNNYNYIFCKNKSEIYNICKSELFKAKNDIDNKNVDNLAHTLLSEKYKTFSSEKEYSLIKILRRLKPYYLKQDLKIYGNNNFYSLSILCDNNSFILITYSNIYLY